MKVLVIGGGGREHALCWKLSQEAEVIAAPGNPGIAAVAECVPIPATDHDALVALASARGVDLAVVGPEDPLIAGLADCLRAAGIDTFGPGASGARLEGSKAFAKSLMKRAGVPTAAFGIFDDPTDAHAFVDSYEGKLVVKASGAALGKGAVVTDSREEAHETIDEMMVEGALGEAGKTVVLEQRLDGPEFSLISLCSDGNVLSLPVAQDHKRIFDGDRGPNTGGMGTYSPVPWVTPDLVRKTEQAVVRPVLRELGESYRGVLFSGLMMHNGVPHCLEYNVRFGDPETQSIMVRLGGGFAQALLACAKGQSIPAVAVLDNAAVTVVAASGGYPGSYEKGKPIALGEVPNGVQIFHAGTAMSDGRLATAGGRVVAVTAAANTLPQARTLAYDAIKQIHFEGMQYRADIAASSNRSHTT